MARGNSFIGIWFSLLLGMLFALCTLFLVLFGADVYTSVLSDASKNDVSRTATLYITNKVRQSDEQNGVSIGSVEGDPALLLKNSVEGESVFTYLYLNDGALCEVTAAQGTEVKRSSGQPVLALQAMHLFIEQNGLLHVELLDISGHSSDFVLSLRTKEGRP